MRKLAAMAAPKFAPVVDQPHYESPPVVPDAWSPDRPGAIEGFQPVGRGLGAQGPDQGFALTIAARLASTLHLQPGERTDDAVRGCLGIALRRASLYSRAPVVHDVRLAFTIWGYFLADPPADLAARRAELFEGVGNVNHHYAEGRRIADFVPEATLRLTPEAAAARMPDAWRELTGA
ncbi:MAG TPA: hypothetical protein VNQ73_00445 [Ilumatobacter sp.]|nr:hypothetical protein [Ilumatobacter sp.]